MYETDREKERRGQGKGRQERWGVWEGFMGVIMENQWLGHWHWGIFSHPPSIVRWMEQWGISTATYGRERVACCFVRAVVIALPLWHRGIYMSRFINGLLNPFNTMRRFDFRNVNLHIVLHTQMSFIIWHFLTCKLLFFHSLEVSSDEWGWINLSVSQASDEVLPYHWAPK